LENVRFLIEEQVYNLLLLEVICAIGAGMVLLAGLIWLPRVLLAVLSFVILVGHNLLPPIQPVTADNAGWAMLHNTPFVLPLPGLPPRVNALKRAA
jgi:uncharacterized membrane protein